MPVFRHLRTKLAILYATLFGVGLLVVSSLVYVAISRNAEQTVRGELQASATVFDRVWALRARQLEDSASILSRDFGFREAVATRDDATIQSALDNLRGRLGLDLAFIVNVDGTMIGDNGRIDDATADSLWTSLDRQEGASGVIMLGDTPYQMISAPVMAPVLTGWVVFAAKLDDAEMNALEKLSAIAMEATVLDKRGQVAHGKGDWVAASTQTKAGDHRVMSAFVDEALATKIKAPRVLSTSSGKAIALVKPLRSVNEGRPVVLLLRYPLAKALAPYRPLLWTLVIVGVLGVAALLAGSWALARSLTGPIVALDEAARRMQKGEHAAVKVESSDEIGRLAASFNLMSSEIRERERKITHLALHDNETNLPNRLSFERHIAKLIDQPREGMLIVATLSVDRFQTVRSAIGYRLVSALLSQIGERIARLHPDCKVSRLSTEVMGFVFETDDLEHAKRMINGLLVLLERPHRLGADTIDVNCTFGLAALNVHGQTAPVLLERANVALDQARGHNHKMGFFDEAAYGDPASNLSLMSDMLRSIVNGDMMLYYQPKYDLRRGCVNGTEALVRWKHPTRGMLPPDLFIGMAEETGAIRTLTEWVLSEAIADQLLLGASGHDMRVSINISGRLMNDEDFALAAINMVEQTDAKLCFEITETAVIENPAMALDIIAGFVAAGIQISIDDYGSGLSSLTYLKQIRAHELKIDKSFILSLTEGHRDALLVKSTIDLAHSLGLKVTAEGVETPAALAALASMGCDFAQGYLIARPMPMQDFLAFVANGVPATVTLPVLSRREAV